MLLNKIFQSPKDKHTSDSDNDQTTPTMPKIELPKNITNKYSSDSRKKKKYHVIQKCDTNVITDTESLPIQIADGTLLLWIMQLTCQQFTTDDTPMKQITLPC
ncbi:unnamed protein product [Rhizophagus irregularis]|nr:unnamed protein product [Rhizophagus irregularis]